MNYSDLRIAKDRTHHIVNGNPAYESRFRQVEKFHPPGLAPVEDDSGAYHIRRDGSPAYTRRFKRVFGFYDERAAVASNDGWYHILPNGSDLYKERYRWVGNFQEGFCTVRDENGHYFHLQLDGSKSSERKYLYAGDFRNGTAVVREMDGLCSHVGTNGQQLHNERYLDLDVYHKGYARARDSQGWFHIDIEGRPIYAERFLEVEPFYNGHSLVRKTNGEVLIIDESCEVIHTVLNQDSRIVKDHSKEKLMDMLVGYWKTQILHSVVRLGILDYIKEGGNTFDSLLTITDLPKQSLQMILDVLRVWDFVGESDGEYRLEYVGELLTEGHQEGLKHAAMMWGEEHYIVMSRLLDALKTYHPQFRQVFGDDFFDYFVKNREKGQIYNKAMEEYGLDYDSLVSLYDFSGTNILLDVGGGAGRLLTRIVSDFENIQKGVLFDLPSVIEDAESSISGSPLKNRIRLVPGNFFEEIPIKADTVLMSRVIHDWNDEKAVRVLENVHDALEDGGRLLLFETVVPENSNLDIGTTLNFNLLVTVGGKERTIKEFETILGRAGLSILDVKEGNVVSIIVAEKAKGEN